METVAELPVLDKAKAIELLGLDEESIQALLALFCEELPEWQSKLDTVSMDDSEALRAIAHRLKSDAANVGAMQLNYAAMALETAVRTDASVKELQKLHGTVVTCLSTLAETLHM